MAKEELLEMRGVVMEVLPDSRFRVTLDNGHNLVAYTAGKMRKHHIRIIARDVALRSLERAHHVPPHRRSHASATAQALISRRRPTSRVRRPRDTRRRAQP